MCVGDGNIKENIHVICWKSVDFISVKNIQVVVVDSWKKWLNFVSSVYVMIECIEKKIRSDFVNDDLRNGYALSLSLWNIFMG